VEGVRTDIRVVCLPYLITDWYIDQMKRQAYDSDPVPFSMEYEKYRQGLRDYLPIYDLTEDTLDLKSVVAYIASDRDDTRRKYEDGVTIDFIPGRHFRIPVDSAKVVANGTVPPEDAHLIVPAIEWTVPRNTLYKNDMMILDLLATNNWERPVYFTSITHNNIMGLKDYFRMDGFAYRLVPIKNQEESGLTASINSNILYDNLVNKFEWADLSNPDIYTDFYTRRTTEILRIRYKFVQLAVQLNEEGDSKRSVAVLDKVMEVMPIEHFPQDVFIASIAEAYYMNNMTDKANELIENYADFVYDELDYLLSLQKKFGEAISNQTDMTIRVIQEILRITGTYGQKELSTSIETKVRDLANSQK
jgi:hypothetical protein